MHRRHRNTVGPTGRHGTEASDLCGLVTRMNLACAEGLSACDAPLSRELFRRVESDGQSISEASRALGLGARDGTYLLSGLRRDVAAEFVSALLAPIATGSFGRAAPPQQCCAMTQPTDPKGDLP